MKPLKITAIFAFLADIIAIVSFIFNGTYSQYWSHLWITDISLILFLVVIGFYLISQEDTLKGNETFIKVFGLIYGFLSLLIYLLLGFSHIYLNDKLMNLLAIIVMLGVVFIVAMFCLKQIPVIYTRYFSYFFSTGLLIFISFMIHNYSIDKKSPTASEMLINILISSVGAGLFMFLYSYKREQKGARKRLW